MSDLMQKRKEERIRKELERRAAGDKSVNLAKGALDKDTLKVTNLNNTPDPNEIVYKDKIPNKINTRVPTTKVKSGSEWAENIAKKLGRGAKMLPVVGALASLAMNPDDAAAAIPVLDSADDVGMSASDEDQMLAETDAKMNYEDSQAKRDRLEALAKLSKLKGQ